MTQSYFECRPPAKTAKVTTEISQIALNIWHESLPLKDTVAEKYLNFRGIYNEIWSQSLRYHPSLYHSPTKLKYPAMVAKITSWSSYELTGVHRTYLNNNGHKADMPINKMMLGQVSGGAVKLSTIMTEPIILAEGIETAMSVLLACGLPTWTTLSTSGLINIDLPPPPMKIMIAMYNDDPGQRTAKILTHRLLPQGYKVKIAKSFKENADFNDLLLEEAI